MKCLIVDDEAFSREFLRVLLHGCAECHQAGSGTDAVEKYRESLTSHKPFDLILMDVMMPGMNGQDAVKAIRALEESYQTPQQVHLIILTGLSCPGEYLTSFCRDDRFAAFLSKPVSKGALFSLVQRFGLTPA